MDFPKLSPLPMLRSPQEALLPNATDKASASGDPQPGSFLQYLNQAMGAVNQAQVAADSTAQNLAIGKIQDLSQVTIASEKATLMLQLTVQVRNKVLEAYQEMMRMQL